MRSSFSEVSDITLVSVSKLSWMLACLKESNRLFPPLASWLPRRLVKGNAVVAGDVVPEGVSFLVGPPSFLFFSPFLSFLFSLSLFSFLFSFIASQVRH